MAGRLTRSACPARTRARELTAVARLLTTRYAPSDWTHRARCHQLEPEDADLMFFPPRENEEAAAIANRTVCALCPVLHECLTFALVHRTTGVWAGTTTDARQRMLKTRSRVKCPVCRAPDPVPLLDTRGGREVAWQVCLHCGASWQADRRNLPPLRRALGSGRAPVAELPWAETG